MNNDNEIAGDPTMAPHLLPPPAPEPRTVADFVGLLRTAAAQRDRWEPLVAYDPASRWYHRLATGRGHELWLLSWLPGQGSGRHGHGPSHGVFTVLDGELTEYPGDRRASRLLPGTLRVFAPGYVHEVVNTALRPAVSLHLYTPGLTAMPMVPQEAAHARPAGAHPAAHLVGDGAGTGDAASGSRPAHRTVRRC